MRHAAKTAALAALALLAAAPAAAAPRRFTVAPPPPWVEPLGWDRARAAPPDAADGLDHALVDEQLRLAPTGEVERYRHLVWRILSTTGVENGSEVRASFDPSFERLELHAVVLHRAGRRIDALDPAAVKVIEQEEDLDRRLYDGRLTAVLFLRGVRAGDAVEVSYTIRGANPVFGGRFADELPLGYGVPVGRLGVRLLVPDGRTVSARTHGISLAPALARRDGFTERRWERADAPATVEEDDVPPGADAAPWLQLSEWRDWGEVASWAATLHAVPAPTAAMEAELARWRALPEEERILAATRFVQDEVRYLGIELGASSHRPHAPAEVLERRFGDCKDKSLLLVTLLRALGVEAETALVATDEGEALDGFLPSPIAFDHVVVRVRSGGRFTWLDPTVTLERGPLAGRALPFRRALPVRPGASLVALEEPPPERVVVASTLAIPRFGEPATLEVRSRREGEAATWLRQRLASEPRAELARGWLDFYARLYRGVRAERAPEVKDDPVTGTIEVVERYVLPPFREGDDLPVPAAELLGELEEPKTVLREQPLEVRHPVEIRETIRVVLPGRPAVAGGTFELDARAARLEREVRVEDRAVVVDLSYATRADRVAAAAVPAFAGSLREMRRAAGATLPLALAAEGGAPTAAKEASGLTPARVLAGLAVLGGALLGGLWLHDGGSTARRLWRRRALARKRAE